MGLKLLKVLALAVAVHHSRCRQRAIQTELAIVKDRMDKRARNAASIMIALASMSDQEKGPREWFQGVWASGGRGSTASGYLCGGPAGRDEVQQGTWMISLLAQCVREGGITKGSFAISRRLSATGSLLRSNEELKVVGSA
jgi:hypothetical protein